MHTNQPFIRNVLHNFRKMGLLKIIRKTKKQEKEMRLLMLGLDNAGKTSILMTFCEYVLLLRLDSILLVSQ